MYNDSAWSEATAPGVEADERVDTDGRVADGAKVGIEGDVCVLDLGFADVEGTTTDSVKEGTPDVLCEGC